MDTQNSPDVQTLLNVMRESSLAFRRREATEKIGMVRNTNIQIVALLVYLSESDEDEEVRRAATEALLCSWNKEFLENNSNEVVKMAADIKEKRAITPTISEDRFPKIAIIGINVFYLIAVLPAAYVALFAVGLVSDTVIVFYCIGLPIIMACAAVIALIMNHPKGNRTLAWRFTALPLVYLFMSLCIPGLWWRLPEPIPVTYAVPSVVPFTGWKGRITGMEVPELAAFDAARLSG